MRICATGRSLSSDQTAFCTADAKVAGFLSSEDVRTTRYIEGQAACWYGSYNSISGAASRPLYLISPTIPTTSIQGLLGRSGPPVFSLFPTGFSFGQ